MEDNQVTINLGGNIISDDSNELKLTPMNDTIVSSQVNESINVETLQGVVNNASAVQNTISPIQVNQSTSNLQAAAQVVTQSTTVATTTTLNTNEVLQNTVVIPNQVTIQESNSIEVNNSEISNSVVDGRAKGTPIIEEEKFTMYDTFIVNTEMFKTMISNAKKAAINDSFLIKSTILDIVFDNEYLKVVATDGDNVLVQTNKNIGFTNTLHFNVAAEFFANVISKLTCDKIEFKLNTENRYIDIMGSDNSEFHIPEFYDRDSGQNISLERPEGNIQQGDIEINIDGIQFKQLIQSASSLAADSKLYDYISGVYCSDRILSTDAENMFGLPNLSQLKDYSFYLTGKFVKLLLSLNFSTKSKIVLRFSEEDSTITHVMLVDDNMILEGSCDLESTAKYPVDLIKGYITKSFDCKFTIEKSKLESVLKVAEIFIEANTDNECCIFTPSISKSTLEVRSINKQAHQYIPIQGLNIDAHEFNLRVHDLIKVLSNCSSDIITVEIDNQEYKNIRILDKDFVLITAIQHF